MSVPAILAALTAGRAAPAIWLALRARSRSPRADDPESWFRRGLELHEHGHATAAGAYQRADELNHGGAATNLGVLYEQTGDRTAAEACYRRADLRGDPHGAFNLAMLLETQSQLTEAAQAYERAERRGHPQAAVNLGVLLETQGDLAAAERCYRRGDLRGDPNGTFNLAALLEDAGEVGARHRTGPGHPDPSERPGRSGERRAKSP